MISIIQLFQSVRLRELGVAQVGVAIGALAAKRRVSLKEMAAHVLRAESPEADREEGDDTGALVQRT